MAERRDNSLRRQLSDEMVELFKRGSELQAAGHADGDTAGHAEFVQISKRLEWTLCQLPLHCASLFDPALDGEPPDYLTSSHGMFIDWGLARSWRQALRDIIAGDVK